MLQGLFNFTGLKVPVTAVFYQQVLAIQGPQQHLVPNDDAASAMVTFTELLQTAPDLPFSNEMNTSFTYAPCLQSVEGLENVQPSKLEIRIIVQQGFPA